MFKLLAEVSGVQSLHVYLGNDLALQTQASLQLNKFYAEALGFVLFWICSAVTFVSLLGFVFYKLKQSKEVKSE